MAVAKAGVGSVGRTAETSVVGAGVKDGEAEIALYAAVSAVIVLTNQPGRLLRQGSVSAIEAMSKSVAVNAAALSPCSVLSS
jgi:hypothetical protein